MNNYENKEFYPTPKELLETITADCNWLKINTVLEPSAGKGHIVEFLQERAADNHKSYDIDCIEVDPELRAILKEKHMRVIHDDFLTYRGYKKYDLILLNPPFSNGDEHLLKAMEVQKNGGFIICILNAETIRNPYSRKRKELINKLQKYHAKINYLSNTFSDAERKTEVEVAVIKMQIPEAETHSRIFEELRKAKTEERLYKKKITDVAKADYIEAIITQYEIEVEGCLTLLREYQGLAPYILENMKETAYAKPVIELKVGGNSFDGNSANKVLLLIRRKYWKALFEDKRFTSNMTSKQLEEYRYKISDLENYDFSYYNVKTLQAEISRNFVEGIEECIISLFDELSHEYSWLPETGRNIHYYNGWATNKAHMINKKVIIPMPDLFSSIWKKFQYRYKVFEKLNDIEKVFNYLSGVPGERSLGIILQNAEDVQQTKNIDFTYFTVNFYKKGTCHITFKDEELLKKFNIFGSQKKGWLPPCYGKKPYKNMTEEEKRVIDEFDGREKYLEVFSNSNKYLIQTIDLIPQLTELGA